MGGRAIEKQVWDKYFSTTEEDVHIWKIGGGPRVYVRFVWHNDTYRKYSKMYWEKNLYFPFRFKKRYKIILVDEWR